MMEEPSDKNFRFSVEEAIRECLDHSETPGSISWENLAGTGDTSKRSLVKVETEGGDTSYFVVKRYAIPDQPYKESLKQAWRECKILRLVAPFAQGLWRAPAVKAFLPEHATLIMEYCPGENVNLLFWRAIRSSILSRKNVAWCLALTNDIADILKEVQKLGDPEGHLIRADENWYAFFLAEQLDKLKSFGFSQPKSDSIRRRFDEVIKELLSDDNRCFQHSDYYLSNLLSLNGSYSVLDFPNAVWGTKYWDVSHMIVSFEDFRLYRNVDASIIHSCINEFLKHFKFDPYLVESMQIVHYVFSFKIRLMASCNRLLYRDPWSFYESRIDALMKNY